MKSASASTSGAVTASTNASPPAGGDGSVGPAFRFATRSANPRWTPKTGH
jgi:hypothetical protein